MIVVFDANIWISHLYANAPLRASVLLYLRRKGATVALPEVVRLEVERHLKRRLREFRDNAADNYDRLLKVFGRMKEASFPSDQEIDARVGRFFEDTGFSLRDIPFSLESARDSFIRTVDKRRPSHGKQQFKDGVIWADCLKLMQEEEVILVASDSAFFEENNPKKGMAEDLAAEANGAAHSIKLLHTIYDFVAEVRQPLKIDEDQVIQAVKAHKLWEAVQRYVIGAGLTPEAEQLRYEVFATEEPNVLALSCDLRIPCVDARGEGRTNAEAFVVFDCKRHEITKAIDSIAPSSLGIKYLDADGELIERKDAYLYAEGIFIGHREVVNRFREPLA